MTEQPLYNLDGYLQCLRRLSDNKCDYWAEVIEISDDVESSFRKHISGLGVKLVNCEAAGYREIEELLKNDFGSSLKELEETSIKLFVWDVVEYIQMAFRDIKPELDPIHKRQSFIAGAQSEFHGDYSYVVVPVKGKAIVVGAATRA